MLRQVINRKKRETRVHAFIDNQNLNLGVQKTGWKMDWRKFREFLRNEYGVTHAFMFIGYMQENEDLYKQMHDAGFLVILKPTVGMFDTGDEIDDNKIIKGNTDAELVLHAMIQYKNYDKAIIVSGDGDFHCLVEYLKEKGKLLHLMTPNWKYSSLLKEFDDYIVRIDLLRNKLAYRDRNKSGSKGRSTSKDTSDKQGNQRPRDSRNTSKK